MPSSFQSRPHAPKARKALEGEDGVTPSLMTNQRRERIAIYVRRQGMARVAEVMEGHLDI